MYYVRWFDPRRQFPLRRDFHTKRERDAFLDTLPFLYETGKHYRIQGGAKSKGPRPWHHNSQPVIAPDPTLPAGAPVNVAGSRRP